MRDFLDSILVFITAESLSDLEFERLPNGLTQTYNQRVYKALDRVLEQREAVSSLRDRLKFYFLAKGVDVVPVPQAQSNILLGIGLNRPRAILAQITGDDEMDIEGTDIKSTGVLEGYSLRAQGDGTSNWFPTAAGEGDVTGPEGAIDNALPLFSGTSGKVLKQAPAITGSRALASNANGVPVHSAVTSTELGHVAGVTSSIQTQLNGKASTTDLTNGLATKQDVGNYITALTGQGTASGPGSATLTLDNAAVIAKVLTGLTPGAGSVEATDSILQAIQKLIGNVALKSNAADPEFTGSIRFGNYRLHPVEHDAGAPVANALTVNWTNGSAQRIDLDANITSLTLSNPVTGGAYLLKLQADSGAEEITWPGTVDFGEPGEPPLSDTAAGEIVLVNLYWDGSAYLGSWVRGYGV